MNLLRFATPFLIAVSLVSCATLPATTTPAIPGDTAVVPPVPPETSMPTPASAGDDVEEAQIWELVEGFGKRLQNVSLLAPDAAQQIRKKYAEFVSPALLEKWMNDLSAAPGRMVSSPWPDRIEVISLERADADTYEISGHIIEVTSNEVVNGGEAGRVLVHIVVKRSNGGWWITEYSAEQ
jgi:hypothetical protein